MVRLEARSSYLKRLELSSPRLRVRLELVRTTPRLTWTGSQAVCASVPPVPLLLTTTTESVTLSPRDEYTLRLINEGSDPAYVVVLDLQPGGKISQIYPLPESLGADNFLLPGKSFLVPDICFYAEEPFGTEMLKLVATAERLDFGPLLSGGYAGSRGGDNPLASLFAEAGAGTRGAAAAAPAGAGTTYSVTIEVVPRRPRPRRP
jgi:hypothetical protein